MNLGGLSGTNLSCEDDTASIVFKDCTISLDGDFEFANGSILINRDVTITGTSQFKYSSVMASTVGSHSGLSFNNDTTFYYAPASNNRDLLYLNNYSSCLYLNSCTLKSTSTGMRLDRGRLLLDNDVNIVSEGSQTSELICFESDLSVKLLGSANVKVCGGGIHYA